jgi:hypothetical protein
LGGAPSGITRRRGIDRASQLDPIPQIVRGSNQSGGSECHRDSPGYREIEARTVFGQIEYCHAEDNGGHGEQPCVFSPYSETTEKAECHPFANSG